LKARNSLEDNAQRNLAYSSLYGLKNTEVSV